MNLQPKIKVEIVVCDVPVESVIQTAQNICHTGQIGDGKIFVTNLDNAVRIRTGETGSEAIRDRMEDIKIVNERAREAKDKI